jgi:hypothetical protein
LKKVLAILWDLVYKDGGLRVLWRKLDLEPEKLKRFGDYLSFWE